MDTTETLKPGALPWIAKLMLTCMTASQISEAVFRMAVAWWMLDVFHSPALFGAVIAVSNLAMVVSHATLGWIADCFDRRRVMALAYAADLLACIAIAALAWGGAVDPIVVSILLIIGTVANSIAGPVHSSLALDTCSAEEAQEFIRHRTSLSSLTGVLGPVLAGGMLSFVSAFTVILLHVAVLMAITIALLFLMAREDKPKEPLCDAAATSKSRVRLVFSGLTTLWSIVPERSLCAQSLLVNLAVYPLFAVLLPVMVKETLMQPAWMLGACEAAFGIGALLISTSAAKPLIVRWGRYRTALLGRSLMMLGVLCLMIGLLPWATADTWRLASGVLSCVALSFIGGGFSFANISVGQARAMATPNAYRNRLMSGAAALVTVAIPIGSMAGGWMVANVGALPTFGTVFVILGLATALTLLDPHSKRLLSLDNESLKTAYSKYLPDTKTQGGTTSLSHPLPTK